MIKIGYNPIFDSEFIKNEDGTYDHPDDTVPVSLLRRHFREEGKYSQITSIQHHKIWKFILCKIEYTMEAISNNKLNFKDFFRWNYVCHCDENSYGLTKAIIETIYNSKPYEFTVMKAILARVEFGHRMLRYFSSVKDRRMLFASQLFIDTHLDLLIYIIGNNCIQDYDLRTMGVDDEDIQSAFDKYYPYDWRFAYCGDAPDLTTCADLGNIWFDIRPRTKTLISYIIHIFCSKTLKHKCSKRNFLRILITEYANEFPILNEIYKIIIEISLMGNYPHAEFRVNFLKRLQIRSQFHHYRGFDDTDLFHKWMQANEEMIVCITKEYHMYTVTGMYALDKIMEETKNWKNIKKICVRSMDMIRSMISNFKLYSKVLQGESLISDEDLSLQLLSRIKRALAFLEQKMSILIDKLKKCGFLGLMLAYIDKFYQSNIVEKKSTVSITSEDYLSKEVIEGIDLVASWVSLKYTDYVPTKYLKCFGITQQSYEDIRDFYYRYEVLNTPDNSLKVILENIYNRSKEDFFILRHYFYSIKKCRNIEILPFTQSQFEDCMHSIKVKRMIEPWTPLTEQVTRYYFCAVCNKWAHPIVDPNDIRTVVNIYSIGKEKVSRDVSTQQLFCGKQVTSITIKNAIETDRYTYKGTIDDEGLAKQIRAHKSLINCTTVPLRYVHLFGKIVSMGGKKWVTCSICTQPTVFEGAKYGPNGFTCCFHENTYPRKRRQSPVLFDANDPLCIARSKAGYDKRNEALNYCIYCNKFCRNESYETIQIVDEMGKYEDAVLCSADCEMLKENMVINFGEIVFKEALFQNLNQERSNQASIPTKKQRKKKI